MNLQQQYHELDKKNSVFDQMYKLYTKRLVNKDTFKAMTGIEVKAMPKPHKVVVVRKPCNHTKPRLPSGIAVHSIV